MNLGGFIQCLNWQYEYFTNGESLYEWKNHRKNPIWIYETWKVWCSDNGSWKNGISEIDVQFMPWWNESGQIKNVIESQGIEYPAKYKKDKIVGWSLAEIRNILSDPVYGNERYNAIAKEELEMARRMLMLNTRVVGKRMEISALVGIAACKECGSFLVEKSVSTSAL